MGGLGNDILIGLGGNDTIESDRNIESADRDWKSLINRHKDKLTNYYRDYNFGVTPAETAAISGGNDVISSGTGKD